MDGGSALPQAEAAQAMAEGETPHACRPDAWAGACRHTRVVLGAQETRFACLPPADDMWKEGERWEGPAWVPTMEPDASCLFASRNGSKTHAVRVRAETSMLAT